MNKQDIAEQAYINGYTKGVKDLAWLVKNAFYCEFDELIPSIMADKIDEIVKELTAIGEELTETPESGCKHALKDELGDFLEKASARLDQIQSKQLTSIILELQEYQNKIEQGKMIELPCKVGDTVYIDERTWTWYNSCFNRAYIGGEFFVVGKITSIRFTDKSILIKAKATYRENQRLYKKRDYPISAICKTVFLTREEAEKRLKEITESK